MSMGGQVNRKRLVRIGFAEMLRDVLVASISKGQFPVALLGIIVLASVLKMPPADVSTLVFRIVELLSSGRWAGYVLALLVSLGWWRHARYLRHSLDAEMRRMNLAHAQRAVSSGGDSGTSTEVRS